MTKTLSVSRTLRKSKAAGTGRLLNWAQSNQDAPSKKMARSTSTGAFSFLAIYKAEPLARVLLIKKGLPAHYLDELAQEMDIPKERLLPALGIPKATASRKVRDDKPLSSDHSERALGMARLVGQVEAMVQESGDPEGFNAAHWVAHWLDEPLDALSGQRPAELIDTAEGQAIVSNLLARMQSGAYA